jgi:hypothetical protein
MNPNLTSILATARLAELEREAGCCTAVAEHLSSLPRSGGVRRRLSGHRRSARP